MADIKIRELRLSFLWARTLPELLNGTAPAAPMAFLGDADQYKQTFDALQNGGGQGGLTPPWFKPKEDFFWFYYLERTQTGDVKGARAWKLLVPLRKKVPFKITTPWLQGRVYLEGFFYPHGVALIVTAESEQALSLAEARELSFKVRQDATFEVASAGAAQHLNLGALADKAMAFLCAEALGPHAQAAYVDAPFSVWTVVRGEGVDPQQATPAGLEVHRVLEAVTTWNPKLANAQLSQLDKEHCAQLRTNHSAGDVLYAQEKARAVWFPGTFTLPPGKKPTLACYHRNLVYASMQVESLGRFVRETAAGIKQPGDASHLALPHYQCAKRAAGILTRFYKADEETTYRSGSVDLHIRQRNLIPDINKLRAEMQIEGGPLT